MIKNMQKVLHLHVSFQYARQCYTALYHVKKKLRQMADNNLPADKIYFFMKCSFLVILANLTGLGILFASNVSGQDLNRKIKLKLEAATIENSLIFRLRS